MQIRCTSCFGQKQVMKLGLIYGDCDACSGTGKIHKAECDNNQSAETEEESMPLEQCAQEQDVAEKTRKKPGPKPKVKNEQAI